MAQRRPSDRSAASGRSAADSASPYNSRRHLISHSNSSRKPTSASSTRLKGPAAEKSAAVCAAVERALAHPALGVVHLEVLDVSCARLQYRLLGTKRYWFRSVKQEKQGKIRWEVKLYQVRCRKSTLEALLRRTWLNMPRLPADDVQLTKVGIFDTEKQAMAALDAAMKKRDATNPFTGASLRKSELPLELVQFFQVLVVSDGFQRKHQLERLDMVYSLLLSALPPTGDTEESPPLSVMRQQPALQLSSDSQLRGFSWIGANVLELPLWRSLTCQLSVSAKTSTQWKAGKSRQDADKPFTERFGLSHVANDRALNVDTSVLPVSRGLAELVAANLGVLSDQHKTNSVPHFYHGLPDEVKRMIAEEQTKTDAARADSLAYQQLTKNNEAAFVKKYLKRRREYLHAAIKLQQLLRRNLHRKTLRRHFRRHLSALTVQRLFRGYQGRKFAQAYFRVCTCASLLIQSVYRSYVSRQQTKALRIRIQWATSTLQRVYRGHVERQFVRWARRMQVNAVVLERLVRGFMGRRRAHRLRLARHKKRVVIPACLLLQRVWRGHRERMYVASKRRAKERLEVLLPAARRIETLLKGFLARRLVKRYRLACDAARVIQKLWRKYRYYKRWMDLMALRRLDRVASRLGALGRGFVARKFFLREKRKRYFQLVVEPSAAHIQRVFRGYMTRKRLEDIRDQVEAAITLQRMWRSRSAIRTIRERLRCFRASIREAKASRIQRCYQCYRARRELHFRRLSHHAHYGTAAVAIQAAWRSYCSRRQLREFRFCSLLERKASALTQAKDDRELIELDMFDARNDLKRVIKYKAKSLRRIKELKAMRIEWERRQPVVDKELSELTEEDLDRGWGEAFETEKHVLRFSLELSVEDILARKQQVREYEAEIEDLRVELEDLERDLEECILSETMELETFRDKELLHAHAMFEAEKARKIRVQRSRWGVRTVRKKLILRERQDLQLLEKELLAKRQVEELGVLAFEKKRFVQLKLEQAVEAAAKSRAKQSEVMMEMKRDASVIRGFDEAVQRMQAAVNEHSFHYRLPKTDMREDADTPICSGCGRITCDCHLQANDDDAVHGDGAKNKKMDGSNITSVRAKNRLARRWRYQD